MAYVFTCVNPVSEGSTPDAAAGELAVQCRLPNDVPGIVRVVEGYTLTEEQYQSLTQQTDPFDAITGAGFFSFGLGVVVACWLVAHAAGLVVQSVRSF